MLSILHRWLDCRRARIEVRNAARDAEQSREDYIEMMLFWRHDCRTADPRYLEPYQLVMLREMRRWAEDRVVVPMPNKPGRCKFVVVTRERAWTEHAYVAGHTRR
jgi:hypothetical protein